MASLVYNAVSGKFDLIGMTSAEVEAYVEISGDTMTGALNVLPSSGDFSIKIKKDTKLLLDGE
jgi:hypothetical protein